MLALTEWLDLRGGKPCWNDMDPGRLPSDPLPARCDIAIVGAGIMGAMLAERLSRDGHRVAIIDRRPPSHGATAASTALVLWAADVPLTHLVDSIGARAAIAAWRRVHRAVLDLDHRVGSDAAAIAWKPRPELYLAGRTLDTEALRKEGATRAAADLPSFWLDDGDVADRFDLPPSAALVSGDAFVVDPLALTALMLDRARAAGATLTHPREISHLSEDRDGVTLHADGAAVRVASVILATGYEAARWYLPPAFSIGSSFAIATARGTAPAWREKAMIWEASDPYLYARGTRDGRIIVGGEDEDLTDPARRDALLATKRGTLEVKGAAMPGLERMVADCAWSAHFGRSPDGLPAIGRARNADRIWLAYGFGGNGISFAALAADLLASALADRDDADLPLFDPYRFDPV